MTLRRTAIAVPAELLVEIDKAARETGESRSKFISRVLAEAIRTRRDGEVTRRLDIGDEVRAARAKGTDDLDASDTD